MSPLAKSFDQNYDTASSQPVSARAELFIGGTDSSLYSGDIEYHDLSSSNQGYWQISGASALVGSNSTVSNFDTIIDSGKDVLVISVVGLLSQFGNAHRHHDHVRAPRLREAVLRCH